MGKIRRIFTAKQREKILASYHKAKASGKRGAIGKVMGKYGITGSYVYQWIRRPGTIETSIDTIIG